ncbi:hypothetical protein [Parabacteroides gordonii]|uniref:hypothetical protein n=1 Tax=Parabacteroides gordonii TaxID=574930 RepID=UPI0026F0A7D8|nr:hypothetical protein [Parabacteroides gordonii]
MGVGHLYGDGVAGHLESVGAAAAGNRDGCAGNAGLVGFRIAGADHIAVVGHYGQLDGGGVCAATCAVDEGVVACNGYAATVWRVVFDCHGAVVAAGGGEAELVGHGGVSGCRFGIVAAGLCRQRQREGCQQGCYIYNVCFHLRGILYK